MNPLRHHQKETVNLYLKKKRMLNLSEVGTGKTLPALTLIAYLKKRALILCPSYLKLNWVNEANKFFPSMGVDYVKSKSEIEDKRSRQVLIASYSMLEHLEKEFKTRDIVIVDEAHYLKELKSIRSRYFYSFSTKFKPEYLIMMTGTPITKHVPDIYPLLAITNPRGSFVSEYKNFWHFSRHFTNETVYKVGSFTKRDWRGVRNREELLGWLKDCSVRYTVDQLGDMPAILDETIILEGKEVRKDEEKLWDDFQSYREEERNLEIFITKKSFKALMKAPDTVSFALDLLEQDEPLVIFTDHREAADHIHEKIKGSLLITGSTSNEDRQRYIDSFQSGHSKCLIGTIRAMGTGITLTAARIVIFNDMSWTPSDNEQASARVRRIGQKKTCIRYSMILGDVDKRINKILLEKINVIDSIVKNSDL